MKASSNHTAKPSDGGGNLKSTHKSRDHAQHWHRGSLLTRSIRSLSSRQVCSEATDWWNVSLHWSFRSTKSLTHAKITVGQTPEADLAQSLTSQVGRILLLPNVKETKQSIVEPSESTWKSSSNRASSKSTSSLSRQFPGSQTRSLLGSKTWSPNIRRLT